MEPRYIKELQEIYNLELGETTVFRRLNGRDLVNLRGEITYFFQGTVKQNDNRLNDSLFMLTPETEWRIEDSFDRNEDNRHLWDLTVTKVETPDKWNAELIEQRKLAAKRRNN